MAAVTINARLAVEAVDERTGGRLSDDTGKRRDRHHGSDRGFVPFLFGQQIDGEVGTEAVPHVGEKEIHGIERALEFPCPVSAQSSLSQFEPSANGF